MGGREGGRGRIGNLNHKPSFMGGGTITLHLHTYIKMWSAEERAGRAPLRGMPQPTLTLQHHQSMIIGRAMLRHTCCTHQIYGDHCRVCVNQHWRKPPAMARNVPGFWPVRSSANKHHSGCLGCSSSIRFRHAKHMGIGTPQFTGFNDSIINRCRPGGCVI